MEYFVKIDGGIGRCVASTGAIQEFAKDKNVSVVTSFPFCFENLSCIERVYPLNTPFLYEDKISKGTFIEPEPYNNYAYYVEEKHLCQVFNLLLNGKDEFVQPTINLTDNEKNVGKTIIDRERGSFCNPIDKDCPSKKIILIQPFSSSGGIPVANLKINDDESYRSFTYPFLLELCETLTKNGFLPMIVKSNEQAGCNGIKQMNNMSIRAIFSMIPFVDGIICCDSFLHHASAALGTPCKTVVLWAGTNEKNLGYKEQINIVTDKKRIIEPNRIPHDHSHYVTKNKGINDFDKQTIDNILERMG